MGPHLHHFGQAELDALYNEGQDRLERFRQALADDDIHVNLNGRCTCCQMIWPCRVEAYRQSERRRNARTVDATPPDRS